MYNECLYFMVHHDDTQKFPDKKYADYLDLISDVYVGVPSCNFQIENMLLVDSDSLLCNALELNHEFGYILYHL